MMSIELPEKGCTGCGACLQSCRVGAITMKVSGDGFPYPSVDKDKCVGCGSCMRACHALEQKDLRSPVSGYAAQLRDTETLAHSSSGGLFFALAEAVLKRGGVVYGCVFNEHYDAVIERAETPEQLAPIHGSKYVWSSSAESYPRVRHDLEEGRQVLFTGLPCQAAGLKKYLGKDFDGLYVTDILCGGAPSPAAFQKYLQTLTDEEGKKTLRFQFRDKEKFGSGVDCSYYIDGVKHHENYLENSFYFAFSSKSRVTWRRSCYSCSYKSLRRVSDLTIGDYWGVEKHHSAFKPKDGVSLVLVNTERGRELLDSVKDALKLEESSPLFMTERNSLVCEPEEGHVAEPAEREAFFKTLETEGWASADRKYLGKRKLLLLRQKLAGIPRKILRSLKH